MKWRINPGSCWTCWPITISRGGDKAPVWVWGDVDLAKKLVKWLNKAEKEHERESLDKVAADQNEPA